MPRHNSLYHTGRVGRRRRRNMSPGYSWEAIDAGIGGRSNRRARRRRSLNDRRRSLFERYPDLFPEYDFSVPSNRRIWRYSGASNNNEDKVVTSGTDVVPAPVSEEKKILKVKGLDMRVATNGIKHHTDKYDISSPFKSKPKLVVRRGQPFDIDIDFSKPYDPKVDELKLVFEAGDNPLPSKKTQVELVLSAEDKPKEWGAKIVSQKDTSMQVRIFTPPDCFVGVWDFSVDVVKKTDASVDIFKYEHEEPVYILFNPWCKDDTVYLDDENLLREYILNENGKIYSGSKSRITSKPWNFGQFESCVLDVAMYLLDVSDLKWGVRGNPIPVVRKISAMVNSQDDGGVLSGNWSGNYEGGRSPLSWTGSPAILEKYWETKSAVLFGQCWVFSGVTTTVCRALGIPCRSVTNFASAHDTDGSVTIDIHYTAGGERDEELNDDSVWNFHVWNEAWMARPDLPKGFGGWQAIDATPQETSDGIYCCGPVSVQAIKQGDLNLPFDGPFIFAEVNADRMHWLPDVTGKFECVHVEERVVGKNISTKAPNSEEREDVTNNYKPLENTAEERAAVLKANQVGSNRKDLYKIKPMDVKFEVIQDAENTWVGGQFEATLKANNISGEDRAIKGRMVVKSMFYTGVCSDKLKSEPFHIKLKPGEVKTVKIVLTPQEYDGRLKDCCMLDLSVWAFVETTNQHFTAKEDYRLRKPHLTIKAPKEVKREQEFKVNVSFSNPLDTTLTKCFVAVDGLSKELNFPQGNVAAKGTFTATLPITPTKVGSAELIVSFNSRELEDINGSHPIVIQAA